MAKTSIAIKIGLFDTTAKSDSIPSSFTKQPFVDMNQLKNEAFSVGKYATLEENFFILDGTLEEFPNSPQTANMGFWSSAQSKSDGTFTTNPIIRFDFSKNHSSIGLTLDFGPYEDYPTELKARWYNSSGNLMAEKTFYPAAAVQVLENTVNNYRRVDIEFIRHKPKRYIKLKEIDFGIGRTWAGESITKASAIEEMDPSNNKLSINQFDFQLMSKENEFSISNPKGIYSMFQQTQEIAVTGFINGIPQDLGTYYLEDWSQTTEQLSDFKAIDAIGVLDKTTFKKGKVYTAQTAKSILDEIMQSSGTNIAYEMDTILGNKLMSGWIPICTHKQAIHFLAMATGAQVDTTRSNKIKLIKPLKEIKKTLTSENKTQGQSKATQKPFTSNVETTAYKFTQSQEAAELYKADLTPGQYEITFSEPMHSLTITGAALTEQSANYAIITVSTPQTVTLTGKIYTKQSQVVTAAIPEIPAGLSKSTLKIENVTIIDQTRAAEVSKEILDYSQIRQEDNFDFILSNEKVGDWIGITTIGGKTAGQIERLQIDLTGGFKAKAKMSGYNKELLDYTYLGEIYLGQDIGVI